MGFAGLMYAMPAMAQKKEAKLGWKLGAQAYSFNRFTLAEALDKLDSCGLKYVECFPGQTIGGGIEGKMDFKMDAAKRAQVLNLLKSKNKTLVAFGVGDHNIRKSGQGDELNAETRPYAFGDALEQIDMTASIRNAQINHGIEAFNMQQDDLEIRETDFKSQTSTVLMMTLTSSHGCA